MCSKKMKKIVSAIILITCIIGFCFYLNSKNNYVVMDFGNGDAKFLDNKVITANRCLMVLNENGSLLFKDENLLVDWLDCFIVGDIHYIFYGNVHGKVGLAAYDSNWQFLQDNTILQNEHFNIDPSVIATENGYYATITEIEGNINNSDPNKENGTYTVHLLFSADLKTWSFVGDILKEKANIEDVKLNYFNNKYYFMYEREVLDGGQSSIHLIESNDGKTWGKDRVLIGEVGDNEPGYFDIKTNEYVVYYSSDKETPGASYNGAKIYKAYFNKDFSLNHEEIISTKDDKGNLLYDVVLEKNHKKILYAKNANTDNLLVIEKIK